MEMMSIFYIINIVYLKNEPWLSLTLPKFILYQYINEF